VWMGGGAERGKGRGGAAEAGFSSTGEEAEGTKTASIVDHACVLSRREQSQFMLIHDYQRSPIPCSSILRRTLEKMCPVERYL